MKRRHKWFLFLFVTLVPFCGPAYSQQPAEPTAREILGRVISTYASCRSYSDEGETKTSFGRRPTFRESRFSTAFVRQGGFQLQFETNLPRWKTVVWKDGEAERFWVTSIGDAEVPFEDSLIRVSYLSGGVSFTVPPLLFTSIFSGQSLIGSFTEPKLKGVEKIDGHQAFMIEGQMNGLTAKLWIDQSSYLILKLYRKIQLGKIDGEITTKYKPAINVEIAAERFVFIPPPEKASRTSGPTPGVLMPEATEGTPSPRQKRFGESLRMSPAQIEELRKTRHGVNDEDVIRVDTDLVMSEVAVWDAKGNIINGLLTKDFNVKEDGQTQQISSFSLGDATAVPRSIVLIIDYSGSEVPYIKSSIDAAKVLVDKLNPQDRMAIVSDDVKLLAEFTTDKEALKAKLELLRTRVLGGQLGRSVQYDALLATLQELFTPEDLRPIVIFQTDGDQLRDLKGQTPGLDSLIVKKRYGLEDLKTAAEKARATIYSIIPGARFIEISEDEQLKRAERELERRHKSYAEMGHRNPTNRKPSRESVRKFASESFALQLALADLAISTGGWADYFQQPEQASDVYARVLNDINTRYVIGYYPTNKARDGKRRNVTIQVRNHPEYVVSGQKAYFAPLPE